MRGSRAMADAPLYKRKRKYTRELHDIELHGYNKLHIVCTSKACNLDKMMCNLRRKLVVMSFKRINVDVDHYKDRKNVINRKEDHTLCGFCPMSEKLIKYATIDAYASYELWKHINDIERGYKDPIKKKKQRRRTRM
ncbi:hypothetical protein ZWY2020_003115 [Hordeum vulgare]|nr:hypothetical protein ZWY2020_003115 [Hordeum vulgare]